MSVDKGILRLSKKGAPQVEVVTKKGKKAFLNPPREEVSQTLRDKLKELDGQEVEFELVGGQPKRIREVGGTFVVAAASGGSAGGGQRHFHNPYNFVPAPPRNTSDPDLGDHRPESQASFDPALCSGRIGVRMVAKTPLLVPDPENAEESRKGHKTFSLRLGADGKPSIPASSIRGMLRSAYEAVTNSRFGKFSDELRGRLAFRMRPQEGLRLIPARVDGGQIHLLTGTSSVNQDGTPGGPMYAAWLPRYRKGVPAPWAPRYPAPSNDLPKHRHEVVCWVEKIQHSNPNFSYWRVREIVRGSNLGRLGSRPTPSQPRGRSAPVSPPQMQQIHGWVCVTNANINRKHDERVFFSTAGGATARGPYALKDEHRTMWRELIHNYQSIHEDDLRRRDRNSQRYDQQLGTNPGQTAWSRHVYTDSDRELDDGTLCYVRLNDQQSDVEAIFPVMIARELYSVSPWDLLPASLRPATSLDELSPADRVFGWVRAGRQGQGTGAVRGLLRVGPVICTSAVEDSVETFPHPGVPLAILSAPKPQQGRFYVARTPNGEAQRDGLSNTEAGYTKEKGLRGRKVYPHQRSLPRDHWQAPNEDRTQTGTGSPAHFQEYRRPRRDGDEQRDDQNRSVLGWVKPEAEFRVDLHVHNLSQVELGALVWLLSLPDEHFHRFGGGKPLGFGSVRLAVEDLDVRTGDDLRDRYSGWTTDGGEADPRDVSMDAFRSAVLRAYPADGQASFEEVPFIRAFLAACKGHADRLPIHYPRATEDGQPGPPSPEGESFRWFVANAGNGPRHALRDLANDEGLPVLE
jgi:CRISPR-associated protein (TIGR03986 family)